MTFDDYAEAADDLRAERKVSPIFERIEPTPYVEPWQAVLGDLPPAPLPAKPGPPPVQNWQIQDLQSHIYGDGFTNEDDAKMAALKLRNELQTPLQVKRTV